VLFNFKAVSFPAAREEIRGRLAELGRMGRGEIIVLCVWGLTALAWVFREDLALGAVTLPGWTRVLGQPKWINDGTIAIIGALLLFVIPVNLRKGEFALDWDWAKRIPWEVLLLFGGGLAMAEAFRSTGLVEWVGGKFTLLEGVPPLLVVLIVSTLLAFSGEVTSNTATAAIMMPILGAMAPELGIHPLLLMFPAGMAISCGFMLPAATPPNAIVFGAGRITVPQMVRAGFLIDLLGVLVVTTMMYVVGVYVFGIEPGALPKWAEPVPPTAP
jgi:sodium-dependent dicarboxylate transporter 2/3/5